MREGLLLDTCAMLWLAGGQPLGTAATDAIAEAAQSGRLLVSAMSAWEVSLAVSVGRLEMPESPLDWFRRFVDRARVEVLSLGPDVLVGSNMLPGSFHKDPADRIIVATARALGVPLVTRDRKILTYADQGHVEAIPC